MSDASLIDPDSEQLGRPSPGAHPPSRAVLALLGPTATGKSALAMALAAAVPCEIINADSRQVYRQLNIGTAKPSLDDRRAIPHHLLDLVDPDQTYSAGDFVRDCRRAIADVCNRGRIPLLVGGTGFYFEALTEGLPQVECTPEIREKLQERLMAEGLDALLAELERLDPVAAHTIARRNPRRVLRALELVLTSGLPLAQARQRQTVADLQCCTFLVTMPRPLLQRRIQARVEQMLEQGLEKEVCALLETYSWNAPGLQTIGYQEWQDYFAGRSTLAETAQLIIQHTRQYAKRQETWFTRRPGGIFHNIADPAAQTAVLESMIAVATQLLAQNSGAADSPAPTTGDRVAGDRVTSRGWQSNERRVAE